MVRSTSPVIGYRKNGDGATSPSELAASRCVTSRRWGDIPRLVGDVAHGPFQDTHRTGDVWPSNGAEGELKHQKFARDLLRRRCGPARCFIHAHGCSKAVQCNHFSACRLSTVSLIAACGSNVSLIELFHALY